VPVAGDAVGGVAGDRLETADHPAAGLGAQHAPDDAVAVFCRQVGPEGVAVPVRKVARVVELRQGRQPIVPGGITDPHQGVRVRGTERQVLRHPLDEPAWERECVLLDRLGDVDLERVRDLVAEHVIGFAQPRRERHGDPRLVAFRETAGALARRARRQVRLREVRMAGVEDQRLTLREPVIEQA
jgi:hypothetical protein